MRQTFSAILLMLLAAVPLSGRGIDEYLRQIDSFQATLQETLETLEQPLEGIPVALLEEAVLIQYSLYSLAWEGQDYPLSVFEMLDSQAAFGLYARTKAEAGAGSRSALEVDSHFTGRELLFWKGHFFLRLKLPEGASQEQIVGLASELIGVIEEPNLYPMAVVQLPRQGLIRDSIRFYLGPEWLRENPSFPAPLRQEVGFDDYAEVAVAEYGEDRQPLFLIGYPTASIAEEYFARIQNALQSFFSEQGVYLKRSGLLISIFPGDEEGAIEMLDRVQYTASVRWIYEKDTSIEDARERRGEVVTFFGIVTSSIVFTGAFMVAVLAGGILAGIFRFWLLKNYPSVQHRNDMVQLHIDS